MTNANGKVIREWKDPEGKPVMNNEIAYLITDMLSDDAARSRLFGRGAVGFNVNGVRTATKTGTTDDGTEQRLARDSWMMSYSTKISVGVWVGNMKADNTGRLSLKNPFHTAGGNVMSSFMSRAHKEVFLVDGTWKTGDWFQKPAGVKTLTINGKTDIYPSWFSAPKNGKEYIMDKVSKKLATDCTPERAKEKVNGFIYSDPVTKKDTEEGPEGWDITKQDDVHNCSDAKPSVSLSVSKIAANTFRLQANASAGKNPLTTFEFYANGQKVGEAPASSSSAVYDYAVSGTLASSYEFKVIVVDSVFYEAQDTKTETTSTASLSGEVNKSGSNIEVNYTTIGEASAYKVTFTNTSGGGQSTTINDSSPDGEFSSSIAAIKAALTCGSSCTVSVQISAHPDVSSPPTASVTASGSPLSL